MKSLLSILFLILFLAACAPSNFVKPLEEKQTAVSASLGGVLTKVPGLGVLPIPNTTIGIGYGIKKNTTIYSQFHPTSAIYGVIHLNLGCTQSIWRSENQKMGISFSPNLQLMTDVFEKNFSCYPQLEANYYWTFRERKTELKSNSNYLFLGCSNWLEMRGNKAHLVQQNQRWMFIPQIGHVFERKSWNFQTDIKWIGPNRSTEAVVVDYISPGNHGGIGVFFSATYKF